MSVNWNPLNLKPWQIGLSTGGGAVLFVVIVVLAVLGSQGVFSERVDSSSASSSSSSSSSSSEKRNAGAARDSVSTNAPKVVNETGTGFLMNTAFTIENITNTSTYNSSFMPKWLGDYSQVDASSLENSSISTAWKLVDSDGKYMVLKKNDTGPRLELVIVNSRTTSYMAQTGILKVENVVDTLPQNIDAVWKSRVTGTNGDTLNIKYANR